jgi:hypothetical protein
VKRGLSRLRQERSTKRLNPNNEPTARQAVELIRYCTVLTVGLVNVQCDIGLLHNKFDQSLIKAQLMRRPEFSDENLLFGTTFGPLVNILHNNRFDPGPLEALHDVQQTYSWNSTVCGCSLAHVV